MTWIQTYSGRRLELLDDRNDAESIDIRDIAHALSMVCRYTGHVGRHYSVAEHSVLVARLLELTGYPPLVQLCGLMHDAHEAYVADLSSPMKRALREFSGDGDSSYDLLDAYVSRRVRTRFGLHSPGAQTAFEVPVKKADHAMLMHEAFALFLNGPRPDWDPGPVDEAMARALSSPCMLGIGLDARSARSRFTDRYFQLVDLIARGSA